MIRTTRRLGIPGMVLFCLLAAGCGGGTGGAARTGALFYTDDKVENAVKTYWVVLPLAVDNGLTVTLNTFSQSMTNYRQNCVVVTIRDAMGNRLGEKTISYDSGSVSGTIPGILRTVVFEPYLSFSAGEVIQLQLTVLAGDWKNYVEGVLVTPLPPAGTARVSGDFDTLPFGRYSGALLQNNVWNRHEGVTGRCSADQTGSVIYRLQNSRNDVVAYPGVLVGHKPWSTASTSPLLPRRIADTSAVAVDFALRHAQSAATVRNTAFDLWLTSTPVPTPAAITTEVMVWLDRTPGIQPAGTFNKRVTVGSDAYDLYLADPGTFPWRYAAFVKVVPLEAGTVQLEKFLAVLAQEGVVDPADYLASIELGDEIITGMGQLTCDRFDLTVK